MLKFEWDEAKNEENIRKHGISFERAKAVFDDDNAVYLYDEDHSGDEDRYIVVGLDEYPANLTVCHCYRGEDGTIIRLISARKATKEEIMIYFGR
jgi:hypothetical protein